MLYSDHDPFNVCFFGHRYIDDFIAVEEKVQSIVEEIINKHGLTRFFVGRNGDFDQIVSSAVKRAKRKCVNPCLLSCVLPYETAEYRKNIKEFFDYYDDVEIIPVSASSYHPKALIQMRNKAMVDRCELVIVYVTHNEGGAYQTCKYALKCGKSVKNLGKRYDR